MRALVGKCKPFNKRPFSSSSSSSSSSSTPTPTPTIDYSALRSSKCPHRRVIAETNGVVNAFVAVSTHPKRHSKHKTPQPLEGLTIGVKDNIATLELPTTCSSGILANYTSPFDATVVSLLRKSGADIIGKTNCDEFGMGSMNTHSIHGAVINPYNLETNTTPRSAGGSSGGSAAAVAAGMCDVALGTDTGGSIRLPASYCGVVGYKPSYGLISRFGVVSYADSLDCVGILGKDVEVVERVGDVLNTYDARDPTAAQPEIRELARKNTEKRLSAIKEGRRKLRIGVPAEYFPKEVSPRLLDQFRGLMKRVGGKQGVEIVPVRLPATPYALSAYYVLASAEASSNLARYDGVRYGVNVRPPRMTLDGMLNGERSAAEVYAYSRTKGFGSEVQKRVLLGCYALSAGAFDNYFLQAQRVRQLVKDDFSQVFGMKDVYHGDEYPTAEDDSVENDSSVDVLMHLSSIRTAPLIHCQEGLDDYVQDVLTVPASLAGLPCVSIPSGGVGDGGSSSSSSSISSSSGISSSITDDGWPVGVSLVGQWGSDHLLFQIAKFIIN